MNVCFESAVFGEYIFSGGTYMILLKYLNKFSKDKQIS